MSGTNIVIDTDFHADVDDVGALALAHALERQGLCSIRAVVVNTPSRHGVSAIRAVNRFYGREEIPIGRFARQDDSVNEPDYALTLAERFGASEADGEAVDVLVSVLRDAEPRSITIVSLGFLDNLAALVARSPELVERSVVRTVVMGGRFPVGSEFNLEQSPIAAGSFVRDWPGAVEFLGWEVGAEVVTGRFLDAGIDPDNPVAVAYETYSGRGVGRMSWDLQTVDLAVRGDRAPYRLGDPGRLDVDADGANTWVPGEGAHRYVTATRPDADIAEELDGLLRESFIEVRAAAR